MITDDKKVMEVIARSAFSNDFISYITALRDDEINTVICSIDINVVCRSQGYIRAYNELLEQIEDYRKSDKKA